MTLSITTITSPNNPGEENPLKNQNVMVKLSPTYLRKRSPERVHENGIEPSSSTATAPNKSTINGDLDGRNIETNMVISS